MKNKFMFILIIMLLLISTSVLAYDSKEAFEIYKSFIPDYTGDNFIEFTGDCDSFVIYYYKVSGTENYRIYTLWFNAAEGQFCAERSSILDFGVWLANSGIYKSVGYTNSGDLTSYVKLTSSTTSFKNYETSIFFLFDGGSGASPSYQEEYYYLTNHDFYSADGTEIIFKANYFERPSLSALNSVYTESSNNINLTIYNNGSELNHYLVLKKYMVKTDEVDSLVNINYSKYDQFYDEQSDSWTLPLNSFYDFSFSEDFYYIVELKCPDLEESVVDIAGPFKVKFSDTFNPSVGDSYDITPTISYYPLSASRQKSVTITSPVSNSTIYYKLGKSEPWQLYKDPIVVTENCTIYAIIYGVDGSSATAQLDITNIKDMTAVNSRPSLGPEVKHTVNCSDGLYYVDLYVEYSSKFSVDYSTDGVFWHDFTSIATHSTNYLNILPNCWHIEWIMPLPKTLYFRYVDENGFYSPTTSVYISATETGIIPVSHPAGTLNPYDENDNYIFDVNYNKDNSSFDISDLLGDNGKVDFNDVISSGLGMGWSIITHFGDFFVLIEGLFIFIPKDIMIIVVSLLIIKFIIALIGFLRG